MAYRMGSTTSGLMVVTRSSPTGVRPMMMISSWGTVCTWTSPGAGGGLTVRCRSREPCAMSRHLVSIGWVLVHCKTLATKASCAVSPSSRVSNAQYCFSKCAPVESNAFTSYEVVCPSTWVRFGASCYNFEPVVQRLTLEEAREHCKHKGTGTLGQMLPSSTDLGSGSPAQIRTLTHKGKLQNCPSFGNFILLW